MIIYHIIQYTLLIIICTYLVNCYSGKTVSMHVKFWSIVTWTLNFAITLLVPEDVYETLNPSHNNITISTNNNIYTNSNNIVYINTIK
jgi:hypothetical protein